VAYYGFGFHEQICKQTTVTLPVSHVIEGVARYTLVIITGAMSTSNVVTLSHTLESSIIFDSWYTYNRYSHSRNTEYEDTAIHNNFESPLESDLVIIHSRMFPDSRYM
jgi:hypothetical protein